MLFRSCTLQIAFAASPPARAIRRASFRFPSLAALRDRYRSNISTGVPSVRRCRSRVASGRISFRFPTLAAGGLALADHAIGFVDGFGEVIVGIVIIRWHQSNNSRSLNNGRPYVAFPLILSRQAMYCGQTINLCSHNSGAIRAFSELHVEQHHFVFVR